MPSGVPQSPPLAAGFLDCSKRPPLVARLQLQALAPELGFVQHTDGYARPDTSGSSAYGGSTQASHTDAALVPNAARPCGAALTSAGAPRAPPLTVAVCAHSRACVLPGITGSSGYAPRRALVATGAEKGTGHLATSSQNTCRNAASNRPAASYTLQCFTASFKACITLGQN